jgi:hypothetical protein
MQGHDRAGAVAEHGRRLVAQVLDQGPQVLGVGGQPALVVLRAVQVAAGEAAPVVGEHPVPAGQFFGQVLVSVGVALGARHEYQQRAFAAGLVVQSGAGYLKDAHGVVLS